MFHQADPKVHLYHDPEYAEGKRRDFLFSKRIVGRDVGGEKTSGKEKRGDGKFKTDDSDDHDLYRDSDHDHGSGVFKSISKWETSQLRYKERKGEYEMKQKLDNLYWRLKFEGMEAVEEFLKDEEGDSNLVAVIVLIVIILAAAAIFREQLMEAISRVFENLMDFIG